jgi:HK97 family phage portal protein
MQFTTLPKNWEVLPAGWAGTSGGGMAERPGKQIVQPSAPLVADTRSVNVDGALQLSTVWACIELRANLIASLPHFTYASDGAGHRQLARGTRLFELLHSSPNRRMTPLEFTRAMVMNHDLRGRAYARIDRAPDGEAVALWPMPADQVESIVLPDGAMAYTYRLGNDLAVLAEENVLHLKGLGNGTEGLSKLDYMRATVHEAASAQDAASRIFGNGGKPTGVLMVDHVLKPDQRKAVAERFAEMQTGALARLFVLEADMKYQQLSLSPEDQQLLETRQFSVEEICRWFGVPPVLVHHGNVTTWGSGIEQILDGFYKLTISPMLVNIEQAYRKRILTAGQRARYSTEIAFDALYRASAIQRAELAAKLVQNGLKTRNEWRQLENDPPLPGGDVLTAQSNLVPIEMLGRIKPTAAPTGASHASPQDPQAQ